MDIYNIDTTNTIVQTEHTVYSLLILLSLLEADELELQTVLNDFAKFKFTSFLQNPITILHQPAELLLAICACVKLSHRTCMWFCFSITILSPSFKKYQKCRYILFIVILCCKIYGKKLKEFSWILITSRSN